MIETAARFVVRTCAVPPPADHVLRTSSAAQASKGCAMCGGPMQDGDRCVQLSDLPSTFTSQPQLSASSVICESCSRLGSQEWMQKYATGLVVDGAVYPFRKLVDVAYWIAHPPASPYVMVVATAKVQHIFWCAEVSLPGEVGMLCLGGRNYPVRYPKLRAAWRVALAFRERLARAQDEAPNKTARAALQAPHGLIVGAFDSLHSGEVSRTASEAERRAVAGLNPGELYLLARIQSQSPDDAERPVPIYQAR